jgi:hypothetical protein
MMSTTLRLRRFSKKPYGKEVLGVRSFFRLRTAPHNEALQQAKPGVTSYGPVFAAERRCGAETCGLGP